MIKFKILPLLFITITNLVIGQQKDWTSSEIQLGLKKLNVLGSVLYVAAHPDDENTRLIAFMANGKLVRTAYLSMTRGDGGQNLIGTEKGAAMGLLRTQELLAARRIDGGQQFFTRAVDFGYSKSPEETLEFWDKKKILSDVVWAIRKFRPDVIITRFPDDGRGGHGHHTSSAILAKEAFVAAADSKQFPEQLKYYPTWQSKRLLLNTGRWWTKNIEELAANSDLYTTADVGEYNPLKGKSYNEISAEGRSQHKSQGFGSSKKRGSHLEYLEHKLGVKAKNDVFDDVNLTWSKISGSQEIQKLVTQVNANFSPENPAASVTNLLKIRELLLKRDKTSFEDAYWINIKLKEVENLIAACAGIWMEATADSYVASPGDNLKIKAEIISRNKVAVKVQKIQLPFSDTVANKQLENNKIYEFERVEKIPLTQPITNPYWLNEKFKNTYVVANQQLIGKPESDPALNVSFTIKIDNQTITYTRPVQYKWTERVQGELYRPLTILPAVSVNISEKVYVFSDATPQKVSLKVICNSDSAEGRAFLKLPTGWKVTPESQAFNLKQKKAEEVFDFMVTPPNGSATATILGNAVVNTNGKINSIDLAITEIKYDHIPIQTILNLSEAKAIKLNIKIAGKHLGYIMGSGDEVPQNLRQIGYDVELLDVAKINQMDVSKYDAIISGIRVYNTSSAMGHLHDKLMEYVENGGTYVMQYNVTYGLKTKKFGPYKFKISRERVTEEDAVATLLVPTHKILNTPNKITTKDFDGWVQERGLYFAQDYAKEFTPLISWKDKKEDTSAKGALIVADYGKGAFIYTGISFFRELPAGVSGAYKLMANIISYKP